VRRHELDVLSLVCGLFFVGVALFGLWGAGSAEFGGWRLPALLIAVGVIGLVATLARRPRTETGDPGEPFDPGTEDPGPR
jgi:hypothetical protein